MYQLCLIFNYRNKFFIAALIPLATGFVWYGPLFGNGWMNEMGFTKESLKG
jgi:hypothetical protein